MKNLLQFQLHLTYGSRFNTINANVKAVIISIESGPWHGEESPREASEEGSPLVARLEGQRRQKVHDAQVVLRVHLIYYWVTK